MTITAKCKHHFDGYEINNNKSKCEFCREIFNKGRLQAIDECIEIATNFYCDNSENEGHLHKIKKGSGCVIPIDSLIEELEKLKEWYK